MNGSEPGNRGSEPRRIVVAIIPARIASSRFPGKVLAPIDGLPMIAHVVRRASRARLVDEVWVATDDERVGRIARREGARVAMTSPDHPSGSDRVADAAARTTGDIVLNLQGDEPLVDPRGLDRLARALLEDSRLEAATLAWPIASDAEFCRPDVVKVVAGRDGNALYFSRSPVPCDRSRPGACVKGRTWKHLGVYGFRRDVLLRFAALDPSPLERLEGLEQLRLLENGIRIRVLRATADSVAVDRPEDVARVEAVLRRRRRAGSGAESGGAAGKRVVAKAKAKGKGKGKGERGSS